MEFVLAPVRRLQEIDLNIAELKRQEEEYPRRMQGVDEEIQARQQEMEGEKAKLSELVKNEKSAKIEADAVRSKIAHYKDQLLSVKTNKEYSALLKEIEAAEKKVDSVEETIIGYMIEMDEHNAHIKKIEGWFKSEREKLLAEKARLDGELRTVREKREQLERERDEIANQLPEHVLRTYNKVQGLRGTALAEARDEFCMECHVRLRPQVYNDLKHNNRLITCDSCDRILFYDGPPPVAQPDAPSAGVEAEDAQPETVRE
ncbi:MAG: C4-type zinc ribbon domain-containing protein [Acidobacteriota bacterium]